MKIPYGVADFYSLRTEGRLYVDRTDRIQVLEDLGKALLFLRPRRFGKTLWLSTLACYYALALEGEHDRLFGDLAGRPPFLDSPGPSLLRAPLGLFRDRPRSPRLAASMPRWARGSGGSETRSHSYLNSTIQSLLSDYREHLPEVKIGEDAFRNLDRLLDVIRQTPYRLYLLIDEYDNFANEVLTADRAAYEELVHSDGPFKFLFKWVKAAIGRKGLDRLFIAGVSPLVMSDVTSGMNIAENVYLYSELNTLCGFTEKEIGDLLGRLHAEMAAGGEESAAREPPWRLGDVRAMLRDWYNGYRFALGAEKRVYNPTLVFYFLKHLQRTGKPPRQMLDSNLAADEGKLDVLAGLTAGPEAPDQDTVIELIRKDEPLAVRHVLDRFTLKELLEQATHDTSFVGSYLFYLGMLTLRKEETAEQTLELVVPNEVIHGLYVERLRKILLSLGTSRSRADALLFAFLRSGDLEPLLEFRRRDAVPDLLEPRRHLGQRADGQDRLLDPAVERDELHRPFRAGAGSQVRGSLPVAPSRRAGLGPLGPSLRVQTAVVGRAGNERRGGPGGVAKGAGETRQGEGCPRSS